MDGEVVDFSLTENFISKYRGKQPKWGPLGYFTFKRTYARADKKGKTEEFWATLQRVVEATFIVQKRHCKLWNLPWSEHRAQRSAQEMFRLMWEFKFLPPGRGLANMGTPAMWERGGACLNNCGFVSTADIYDDFSNPFCWLMDMSMHGVGVGFDTEGAFGKTVYVKKPRVSTKEIFEVADTREGWVEAFRRVLDAYVGRDSMPKEFNFDKIRPMGSPIVTFGGIAPGPEPLKKLLHKTVTILDSYAKTGAAVDSTLIVDLMNFAGEAVVAGGVRRTAEIAFGRPSDEQFRLLKSQENIENSNLARWASNNSILATIGMDYTEIAKSSAVNGEPGFFWLENARAYGRMHDGKNYKDHRVKGSNPCVPGYTLILTDKGYIPIEKLIGQSVNVWNGLEWSNVIPKITGYNAPINKVLLSDGTSLVCTDGHKWLVSIGKTNQKKVRVETKDLKPGMKLVKYKMPVIQGGVNVPWAYCHGYYCGDGQGKPRKDAGILVYDYSKKSIPHLEQCGGKVGSYQPKYKRTWVGLGHIKDLADKYFVPFDWDVKSRLEWIAGLIDSDGTVCYNPNSKSIQISNTNVEFLKEIRLMLTTLGVQAKVTLSKNERTSVKMPGGSYDCKAQYRLLINSEDTKNLVSLGLISYNHCLDDCSPQRDARRFVTVTDVIPLGIEPIVYCFTEHKNHTGTFNGIITSNCGEQSLEPFELCNLVETFPSRHKDMDDYMNTLKYAYLYAKTVTLIATHDPRTNAVMFRNRRIGLSQTGIIENINKIGFRNHMEWCENGYQKISEWDQIYSDWLCVPKSIKRTTVKPSGTVSLLPGCTPGIHFPHSEYYIRRVEVTASSDLWKIMQEAGYTVEKSVYKDNTMVVEFIVHEPNYKRNKNEVSIWEQFELAAAMQAKWSDNQVSITITVRPEEVSDLPRALAMYEKRLKAVSFLPLRGDKIYKQAPYETITKEVYEDKLKKLKKYSLNKVNDKIEERFCDGDSCTI